MELIRATEREAAELVAFYRHVTDRMEDSGLQQWRWGWYPNEELIRENYIEDMDDEALANGLYSGLMESLDDPYAAYYTPEEWISMQQETQGIYYGIGAYLQKDEDTLYPRITGIIKNTPAEETQSPALQRLTQNVLPSARLPFPSHSW